MKKIEFTPSHICARHISVVVNDDNTIANVSFEGGCDGNHKGLCALIKGMPVSEAIARLDGIKCGFRSTSCPDQLAQALKTL